MALQVVTSQPFDCFITSVVIANIAAMACDYYGIEEGPYFALYTSAMLAFGYIYYAEATLKIVAFGPSIYFTDSW